MSDILDMVTATLTAATNAANEKAEKISAATTDRSKRVHELRTDENTEDAQIKAFQTWYEQANQKIEEEVSKVDEYIKGKYLTEVNEEELTALKEEYKELKAKVSAARKFAETAVPGYTPETFKDVPELKSLRGGTSGGGTGGKRPRVERMSWAKSSEGPWTEISAKGKNSKGEEVEKTNFTLAAQRLSTEAKTKVEVKDLQSAAFEAAGTDDLKTLNGRVFDFAYTVGDATYWLRVQPTATEESTEEESTEGETNAPESEEE